MCLFWGVVLLAFVFVFSVVFFMRVGVIVVWCLMVIELWRSL